MVRNLCWDRAVPFRLTHFKGPAIFPRPFLSTFLDTVALFSVQPVVFGGVFGDFSSLFFEATSYQHCTRGGLDVAGILYDGSFFVELLVLFSSAATATLSFYCVGLLFDHPVPHNEQQYARLFVSSPPVGGAVCGGWYRSGGLAWVG